MSNVPEMIDTLFFYGAPAFCIVTVVIWALFFRVKYKGPYPKQAQGNHKYGPKVADVIYKHLKRYGNFKYQITYITDNSTMIDYDSDLTLDGYKRKITYIYSPKDKDIRIRNMINAEIRDKIFAAEIDSSTDFYRLDVSYKDGVLYCASTAIENTIRREINKTLEEICQTF